MTSRDGFDGLALADEGDARHDEHDGDGVAGEPDEPAEQQLEPRPSGPASSR